MISINIPEKYNSFIDEYSKKLTLNGFSNLNEMDLSKSSRTDYQITGLYGEISFRIYRYGDADNLKSLVDKKLDYYKRTKQGDNGYDDEIIYNDKKRFIDVKTSHTDSEDKISRLNLIIPPRELHQDMIYVCAFTIGKNRRDINFVILAGWALTEDIKKKWGYDDTKFCVPVKDLRDMKELEAHIR